LCCVPTDNYTNILTFANVYYLTTSFDLKCSSSSGRCTRTWIQWPDDDQSWGWN